MFLLVLGTIGRTITFSKGRLFLPFRTELARTDQLDVQLLAELLSCPMCLGAWTGTALGFYLGLPDLEPLFMGGVVSLLSWFSCVVCCSLELTIERLRRKS
jgi:hypothetical protein